MVLLRLSTVRHTKRKYPYTKLEEYTRKHILTQKYNLVYTKETCNPKSKLQKYNSLCAAGFAALVFCAASRVQLTAVLRVHEWSYYDSLQVYCQAQTVNIQRAHEHTCTENSGTLNENSYTNEYQKLNKKIANMNSNIKLEN